MPRFDGTGPRGRGPGTGRGMGRCSNPSPRTQAMRQGLSKGDKLELLKKEKEAVEKEIADLENVK